MKHEGGGEIYRFQAELFDVVGLCPVCRAPINAECHLPGNPYLPVKVILSCDRHDDGFEDIFKIYEARDLKYILRAAQVQVDNIREMYSRGAT